MRYLPLCDADRRDMLSHCHEESVEAFYEDIPAEARLSTPLNIPAAQAEPALLSRLEEYAAENNNVRPENLFCGMGAYPHYTPAAVDQLLLRSEFFTAYTPYQPEVSQGTLQAIFEFQTYTASLFGLDIANASMYDGASALAEAVVMAQRITQRPKVVMSNLVLPRWREVTATYIQHMDEEIITVDATTDGVTTGEKLAAVADETTSAVVLSYPNAVGGIEDLKAARAVCDAVGALLVVAIPEPMALGILAPPGALGADIVVGEGRSFGGSLTYGGPGLGMFATRDKWARQMPGRLVGKTKDGDGRPGYVLTLATREQHIRRERATSNICSNQALMATAAAIHLSLLGKNGLCGCAEQNFRAARYLHDSLDSLDGFTPLFPGAPFFNEVAFLLPVAACIINRRLAEVGIMGGADLTAVHPGYAGAALFCATEVHTKSSIDRMVDVLAEFQR